ncbi:hypothetical protein Lal_00042633 [Lupinus albus]|nr:hypothetical protein Lal_00042633 [Lupinus albus]
MHDYLWIQNPSDDEKIFPQWTNLVLLFFENNKLNLYQNSNVIGSSSLFAILYIFDVVNFYNKILQTISHCTKNKLLENSTTI